MMDLNEASPHLEEVLRATKVLYLLADPVVPDFTCRQAGQILLMGGGKKIAIDFCPESISAVFGFLSYTIFDKENVSTLLTWDLKSIISYFYFFVRKLPVITSTIFDLSILEKTLNISKKPPENFIDAVNRMKGIIPDYKNCKKLYTSIHLPLALQVLPALETTPLLDILDRTSKYAHYEIEGQHNGRLRCFKAFSKGYVPHTLSGEQKTTLKPRGYDKVLMLFDIHYCEVSVLQWLSKDSRLEEILYSGEDLYEAIYRIVTGDVCGSENKRDMTKLMFLPVMYGCGAATLGQNLKIPTETARELIKRIFSAFPTATKWLMAVQEQAENISDIFGRTRKYVEKPYLARNLVVHSVAATVCQEKLIDIHKETKTLAFNIHDGYGLVPEAKFMVEIGKVVKTVLEKESRLCPGLFFKTECKVGKDFGNLEKISLATKEVYNNLPVMV